MAKNRSIQTFEKRRRERDKQMKQQAKLEERLKRKADKRSRGDEGSPGAPAGEVIDGVPQINEPRRAPPSVLPLTSPIAIPAGRQP